MSPYMFDAEEDGKTFKLATGMGLEEIALSLANPDLIFIGGNPVDSGRCPSPSTETKPPSTPR